MKKTIVDVAGINLEAGGVEAKCQIADLMGCWEEAKIMERKSLEVKATAQASSGGIPPPMPKKDYAIMAEAFEQVHGKKDDNRQPGKPTMARRLDQITDDDLQADPLSDVTSKEDGEDDTLGDQGINSP